MSNTSKNISKKSLVSLNANLKSHEETIIKAKDDHVGLKRTIGLADGISIIVGNMIGSGIFISPKGVLVASGSIGLCLIIWTLSGLVSLLGALCYIELGTLINESGGELVYILRGFSTVNRTTARLLSFLYSWSASIILKPTAFAAVCLACSTYILGPITGKCGPPLLLIKLGSFVILMLSSLLNAYSVRLTNKVLVTLTFAKILALIIVIIGGIVRLAQGHTQNLENSFVGTTSNLLMVASGFYSKLFKP